MRNFENAAQREGQNQPGASAPSWLHLRPSIFGAASAYRSAKQLGHSVTVAEKHYLGLVKNIPMEGKTLEAAMGIESVRGRIVVA